MNDSNPMEQLRILMERFGEQCDKHGLKLMTFVALPMPEGQPPMIQAVMELDPDKAFVAPEERAIDDQFAEIERGFKIEEKQAADRAAAEEARQDLLRSIAEDDGIGLGDG